MSDLNYSKESHRSEKKLITIVSVIALVLIGFFLLIQSSFARRRKSVPQVIPSPSPVISAYDQPIITHPQTKAIAKSPLVIDGTVPPGWMFEGALPIALYASDDTLIASGTATEAVPGTWTTGKPVGFSVTLSFTTAATSGYVLIAKDNPSGLPENEDFLKVPVRFK